jgi:hypothetical protein
MNYLERVIECEHGNVMCDEVMEWPYHAVQPYPCPGGSRVRVEPDYQAALAVAQEFESEGWPKMIQAAVDTALGVEVEE